MSYFSKRLQSFGHALRGLRTLFLREPNARLHLAATVLVVVLGFAYDLSSGEWIIISLCIGMVFAMELLNSAIEVLADTVHPQRHSGIKRAKDLAAAGVLMSAIAALVAGLLIFIPKIFAR